MKKVLIILGILLSTTLVNAQVINLRYNIEQVTVQISLYNSEGKNSASCTGVVIKNTPEMSEVLTAKHCVENRNIAYIDNISSNTFSKSQRDDLAIIYFDKSLPSKLVTKLFYGKIKRGDIVYHLGLTKNIIYGNGKITHLYFSSAKSTIKVEHGCSGGGVFNDDGELVSVVWGGFLEATEEAPRKSVAEPLNDIKTFLRLVLPKALEKKPE